jgi:hypothetical protein
LEVERLLVISRDAGLLIVSHGSAGNLESSAPTRLIVEQAESFAVVNKLQSVS